MEYTVVVAHTTEWLICQINKLLEDKWKCAGGVAHGAGLIHQAMVRE